MGLIEQQIALAKLYTDGGARKAFYADAKATGSLWGLCAADIDEIVLVPRKQIEGFARSLVAKRRGEVEKFLPITTRLLGTDFNPLFHRHADSYLPIGTHRHREDALAFAGSIAGGDLTGECADYIRDIAKYEQALIIARSFRRPQIRLFRHDVRLANMFALPENNNLLSTQGIFLLLIWPAKWGLVSVSGARLR